MKTFRTYLSMPFLFIGAAGFWCAEKIAGRAYFWNASKSIALYRKLME